MKPDGGPENAGEVHHQAGSIATAVQAEDYTLQWNVVRQDGRVRTTKRLAHTSHWTTTPAAPLARIVQISVLADHPWLRPPAKVRAADTAPTTLFYPDVSNNNWSSSQDLLNFLPQLVPEGFSGVAHKMSEGSYYADPYGPIAQQWCAQNGLPFIGYPYLSTEDPNAQAQNWKAAGGGTNAMFDWEYNGGDLKNFWAVVNGFNAVGVNIQLGYCPKWYWQDEGEGDLLLTPNDVLLISSDYPNAGGSYASVIYYLNDGGDSGPGWDAYGGCTPTIWQFTDAAVIAGHSMDCNAYKGADLAVAFGQTPAPTPAPAKRRHQAGKQAAAKAPAKRAPAKKAATPKLR
jgi:hypothetical protein